MYKQGITEMEAHRREGRRGAMRWAIAGLEDELRDARRAGAASETLAITREIETLRERIEISQRREFRGF